jgi:hypothetical protein
MRENANNSSASRSRPIEAKHPMARLGRSASLMDVSPELAGTRCISPTWAILRAQAGPLRRMRRSCDEGDMPRDRDD